MKQAMYSRRHTLLPSLYRLPVRVLIFAAALMWLCSCARQQLPTSTALHLDCQSTLDNTHSQTTNKVAAQSNTLTVTATPPESKRQQRIAKPIAKKIRTWMESKPVEEAYRKLPAHIQRDLPLNMAAKHITYVPLGKILLMALFLAVIITLTAIILFQATHNANLTLLVIGFLFILGTVTIIILFSNQG